VLLLNDDPKLIGRQITLPSGRLDMLFAYRAAFLLIELKISSFQNKFIQQVLNYKNDLIAFQEQGKLLHGDIVPYLVIPEMDSDAIKSAKARGVVCLKYNPEEVLKYFYTDNFKPIASFVELKPIDIGIWNIHLINKFIFDLKNVDSVKQLQAIQGGSSKSLYNKIRFANELKLIEWRANSDFIALSELGESYVSAQDADYLERLSESQAALIRNYVMQNPYASSVILGIASLVESVFALSKNTYPVSMSQMITYYTYFSGKTYDWKTEKAQSHGANMYTNYAIELGLVAKNGENIYLTPDGFKFVVQMQLHKGLKLMQNLKVV
jgi:hypothetical protein